MTVAALGEARLRHTAAARRGGRGRRAARGARARRRARTSARRPRPRGSPSTSRSPSRWWRRPGIRTPESVALPADTFREVGAAAVMEALVEQLGLPLFVKPAKGGSALGCSSVRTVDELPDRDGGLLLLRPGRPGRALRRRRRGDGSGHRRTDRTVPPAHCRRSRSDRTAASTTTPRATPRRDRVRGAGGARPGDRGGVRAGGGAGAPQPRAARPLPLRPDGGRRTGSSGSSRSTSRPE